MTGIESPVTITTRPVGVSAACVCGWATVRALGPNDHARVLAAWAEHWHDTHTEGDNE